MDIVPPLKRCPKCGEEKPATLEYFQRNKQAKSGLSCYCKPCQSEKGKQYYESNREKVIERTARYAKEHPEQRKEINRKQRAKEGHNVYMREWMRRHRDQMTDEQRSARYLRYKPYAKSHREITRAACQLHYQKNKSYYANKTRNRRAIKKGAKGDHSLNDIRLQYKAQKGLCWWCGKEMIDNYHVDHRIPLSRGGSNAPENLCIACPECNLSKGNKLPHEWNGRLL